MPHGPRGLNIPGNSVERTVDDDGESDGVGSDVVGGGHFVESGVADRALLDGERRQVGGGRDDGGGGGQRLAVERPRDDGRRHAGHRELLRQTGARLQRPRRLQRTVGHQLRRRCATDTEPPPTRENNAAERNAGIFYGFSQSARFMGGSTAEWLACWTRAWTQIAPATLSGKSLRQIVHTHRASVHQAAKSVAALLRVAGVTAGLAESNGSLPPGL